MRLWRAGDIGELGLCSKPQINLLDLLPAPQQEVCGASASTKHPCNRLAELPESLPHPSNELAGSRESLLHPCDRFAGKKLCGI